MAQGVKWPFEISIRPSMGVMLNPNWEFRGGLHFDLSKAALDGISSSRSGHAGKMLVCNWLRELGECNR